MSVIVRPALPGEGDAIADVWLRSRRASIPVIPPPVHTDAEVREWFNSVVIPTLDVWIACESENLVAVLVLRDEWIDQLYVAPEFTGRGLGSQLLGLAMAQRPERLLLWTFQTNLGARRFYERHGFTQVAETGGDNEEGAPDVCYVWRGRHSEPVPEVS